MHRGPIDRPTSAWFASLVALLVALGAQVLLGSLIPADFSEWLSPAGSGSVTAYRASPDALWISGTVIRFLSFAMGGIVAVLLVGVLTGRLMGMLFVAALLATFFAQFPSRADLVFVALWSCAAPLGVMAGGWAASAKA